jgi:hypothetical protein
LLISGRKKYCKNVNCNKELDEFNTFVVRKNGRYYLEAYCKECKAVIHKKWIRDNYGKRIEYDSVLASIYSRWNDLEKKRVKIVGKRPSFEPVNSGHEMKHCPKCGNDYPIFEFITSVPHSRWANGRVVYDVCVKCAEIRGTASKLYVKKPKKEVIEKENLDSVRYRKAMKKFIDKLKINGQLSVIDITGNYLFISNGKMCCSIKNGKTEYTRGIYETWFIYQKMLKAHFAEKNRKTWNSNIANKFFW